MLIINNLLRIIRKNKLDFFLNLTGLSVAMVIFIFASLYVKNEITFDNYHPVAERIFRLTTSLTSPTGQTTDMALANPPFAQILKNSCPEIEEIVCIETEGNSTLKYNDDKFENLNIRAATPSIFQIFSYSAVLGKESGFLKKPNTIVFTETLAQNVFGEKNPLGENVTIGNKDYEVTGVINDLPSNTDLKFSALIPSDFDGTGSLADWGDYYVYMKTSKTEIAGLKSQIDELSQVHYKELLKQLGGFQLVHHLQPLQSIHFDNSLLADSPKGNKTTVYAFSIVALLILIIAGINYNNLTLAQLEKRQKEFSIRRIIGSGKRRIILSIIGESVLIVIFAALLSIVFAVGLMPWFNNLFDKDFLLISVVRLLPPLLLVFAGVGVLSGLYPAFRTIGNSAIKMKGFSALGKSLVTFQNVIAIIMIAGLILIWNQINFMKNAELGFNKHQLMAISIPSEPEKFPGKEFIRQEFIALPGIESLSFGGGGTNLGATSNWMKAIMALKDDEGNNVQFVLNQPQIDENYIDLFGIELLEGRNFSESFTGDKENSVIINETYAKVMGWDNPLGKEVESGSPLKVIGVVKDFHFDALNNPIEPLRFSLLTGQPSYMFVRIDSKYINSMRDKWMKLFPGEAFEFQYMDQHMAALYRQNEKDMSVFFFLTIVAIIISCLGLYGLASHFIISRTKEIGIRKVNGAKVNEVIVLLNRGFIRWVVVALIIATPAAYFIMQRWLENFAYKTTLSWWVFVLAGLLAMGIALLTVSWQSWKAATRNPVEALRYE